MTGDLNCNYLIADDHKDIKNIFKLNALKQLIKRQLQAIQKFKNLIDVFYSNNGKTVTGAIVEPSAISNHDIFGINRKMHTQKFKPRKLTTRNFSKYKSNAFRHDIESVNWNAQLSSTDISWNNFKNILRKLVDKHAPSKEKIIRGKPAPWLSMDIKRQMHERDFYLKKARRTNDDEDLATNHPLRNAVTYAIRQSKSQYCRNLLKENSQKPKDFWRSVKKLLLPNQN